MAYTHLSLDSKSRSFDLSQSYQGFTLPVTEVSS